MNEDDARAFKMRHGWERTFARWRPVTENALVDPPVYDFVLRDLRGDVAEELFAAGWPRRLDLLFGSWPMITVQTAREHADYFARPRNLVVMLAEARALELLTPTPIPKLTIWPRLGPFLDVLTELPGFLEELLVRKLGELERGLRWWSRGHDPDDDEELE